MTPEWFIEEWDDLATEFDAMALSAERTAADFRGRAAHARKQAQLLRDDDDDRRQAIDESRAPGALA